MNNRAKYDREHSKTPKEFLKKSRLTTESIGGGVVYDSKGEYVEYDVALEALKMAREVQQKQPIQINTLTWRDINDLERIINNVHYEFRCGIGEKSFGEEVLERFRDERDEQEQHEIDLAEKAAEDYAYVAYVMPQTFEEKVEMYMKSEKKTLAKMLAMRDIIMEHKNPPQEPVLTKTE